MGDNGLFVTNLLILFAGDITLMISQNIDCISQQDSQLVLKDMMNVILLPVNEMDLFSAQGETFLYFEGITGHGQPPNFKVFLNLVTKTIETPMFKLGVMSFYGLEISSIKSSHSHGKGLNQSFEIGHHLQSLKQLQISGVSHLKVSLEPMNMLSKDDLIVVNKVSLFVEKEINIH